MINTINNGYQNDISRLTSKLIRLEYTLNSGIKGAEQLRILDEIDIVIDSILFCLEKLYKELVSECKKDNVSLGEIKDFSAYVERIFGQALIKENSQIYNELCSKNSNFGINQDQKKAIENKIKETINLRLSNARIKIDEIIEAFKEKCSLILAKEIQEIYHLFKISHARDLEKRSSLANDIVVYKTEAQRLASIVSGHKDTIEGQEGKIRELEKKANDDKKMLQTLILCVQDISSTINEIGNLLIQNRRELKGKNPSEKLKEILDFIRGFQASEKRWAKTLGENEQLKAQILELEGQLRVNSKLLIHLGEHSETTEILEKLATAKSYEDIIDPTEKAIAGLLYLIIDNGEIKDNSLFKSYEECITLGILHGLHFNFNFNTEMSLFLGSIKDNNINGGKCDKEITLLACKHIRAIIDNAVKKFSKKKTQEAIG